MNKIRTIRAAYIIAALIQTLTAGQSLPLTCICMSVLTICAIADLILTARHA